MNAITDALRAAADIVADAVRYGLVEPQTVTFGQHSGLTLIMREFEQVEAWADYLETAPNRFGHGDYEHIDARADVSDVYGIEVRVAANRPITEGAPS